MCDPTELTPAKLSCIPLPSGGAGRSPGASAESQVAPAVVGRGPSRSAGHPFQGSAGWAFTYPITYRQPSLRVHWPVTADLPPSWRGNGAGALRQPLIYQEICRRAPSEPGEMGLISDTSSPFGEVVLINKAETADKTSLEICFRMVTGFVFFADRPTLPKAMTSTRDRHGEHRRGRPCAT